MKTALAGAGVGATLSAIILQAVVPTIQGFEGTKFSVYHDIGNVLTVCSGHTGPDVTVGKVYTPAQCQSLTEHDATIAAKGVLAVSPQLIYHPMQLAAAISFSYNVGVGTYGKSSVASNFNTGNLVAGCNALLKYSQAGGKFSQGLYNRRVQEQTLCLSSLTPRGLHNVAP